MGSYLGQPTCPATSTSLLFTVYKLDQQPYTSRGWEFITKYQIEVIRYVLIIVSSVYLTRPLFIGVVTLLERIARNLKSVH